MTTILTTGQVTALIAQARTAAFYTSTDITGELLPDWYIATNGEAVYAGADIATRGIGLYGQTPANLVLVGLIKPAALDLITDPAMTFTCVELSGSLDRSIQYQQFDRLFGCSYFARASSNSTV
jgi:hypothetical protein